MARLTKSSIQGPAVFMLLFVAASAAFALGIADRNAPATEHTSLDVALLIAFILLALVFSFLCSIAEAVLLSITPSYIAGLQERQPKLSALLKRLKQDNVDQSLAAILTLNTIAHTVGAIGAGAKATIVFGSAWFGLFSAVMTLLILFLSEIIPKTLGAIFWRRLARITALFVRGLIVVLYPLIWISEGLTRLIARKKSPHVFSREEFLAMAGMGERAGQIDEHESRIIRNLFQLASLTAGDVMTPRTVIAAFRQDMTVSEALNFQSHTPFSRLPVYVTDLDHVTGFVLRDDVLLSKAQDRDEVRLETLKRNILTVPAKMPLPELLETLLEQRQHIAMVVGEYGGTKGLVTLEDVVETLLGMEVVDEMDRVEDMQALARQQWAKRAKALGLETDTSLENPTVSNGSIDTDEPGR